MRVSINAKYNVWDKNNKYLLQIFTVNVHHGNQCWEIGVSLPLLTKLMHLRWVSFENGKRQTWYDLYVSGSVYNQIHMHILLYYVCHALQFTEIALKCKMLKGKEMK